MSLSYFVRWIKLFPVCLCTFMECLFQFNFVIILIFSDDCSIQGNTFWVKNLQFIYVCNLNCKALVCIKQIEPRLFTVIIIRNRAIIDNWVSTFYQPLRIDYKVAQSKYYDCSGQNPTDRCFNLLRTFDIKGGNWGSKPVYCPKKAGDVPRRLSKLFRFYRLTVTFFKHL